MAITKVSPDLLDLDAGITISVADNSDNLTLTSTDADANSGPNLRLYRNSGSPADGDNIGQLDWEGRNDNSQDVVYASMLGKIRDNTDGTEDGGIQLDVMKNGSLTGLWKYYSNGTTSEFSINDDSIDMDFRVESDNDASAFFVQGSDGFVGIGTNAPGDKLHVRIGTNLNWHFGYPSSNTTSLVALNDVEGAYVEARIDALPLNLNSQSGGNVGIGTTSPDSTLDVESTQPNIRLTDSDNTHYARLGGSAGDLLIDADLGNGQANSKMTFGVDATERMRINDAGLVCIGDTTERSGNQDTIKALQVTGGEAVMGIKNETVTDPSQRGMIIFTINDNSAQGRITCNNSSTLFTSLSDYRLKEVLEPLPNGLDRLNQLKPVKFKWKKQGYNAEGFLAHEVAEIVPEAVSGKKDGEDMQSLDYGRITPLLVKAIQELTTKLEAAEARITTLEG